MKTWTITDVDGEAYLDDLHITPEDFGLDLPLLIRKRTLRGGLREGVDLIEVDNGRLKFSVIPTRGMGLWRASLGDLTAAWQSPVRGPVNPSFVPVFEPSGIGWLTGFDELLVRCGLESNGAPQFGPDGRLQYPLHGRIANVPAHHVEVTFDPQARAIAVRGTVDEARLFGTKFRLRTTYLVEAGQPRIKITDEVTNLSAEPATFELLYHTNFGAPLATPGSRVVAPIHILAPRDAHSARDVGSWDVYGPAQAGLAEYAHFAELLADHNGRTRVMLVAADGRRAASLQFNRQQLPCFTLWKSQRLPVDGYVTGLEPGVNFPNTRAFEEQHERVRPLAPGQTQRFDLELELHDTPAAVHAAELDIATIQQSIRPQLLDKPRAGWSPA